MCCHKGFVTPQQLQQAFKQQKETGLRLGEQLIALGMVTEENIFSSVLAGEQDLSMKIYGRSRDIFQMPAYVLLEDYILSNNVLPVDFDGNTIVAVHRLTNHFIADEVSHRTGKRVQIHAANEDSIKAAIES